MKKRALVHDDTYAAIAVVSVTKAAAGAKADAADAGS